MCSRTQYKHNVHAAAQCVEVSWTSAFLLPRALTDVLFLLFVPSALRGVQHVTICTFQFCKKAGTCPLVLGPKNWDGLGPRGVASPVHADLPTFVPACMHTHVPSCSLKYTMCKRTHVSALHLNDYMCASSPSSLLQAPPSSPLP